MIDLRSDTVSQPTQAMRLAMSEARLGDDVYGDDPTTIELEKLAAQMLGKEAALLTPSGTFCNQLALMVHTRRGDEVILGHDCHIVMHEVGGAAVLAGVNLRHAQSNNGILDPKQVESLIRTQDIHYPETALICMENAHSNGTAVPIENMQAIYAIGQKHGVPVHLDGARLFNAAHALGVDVKVMAACADTVNVCLSKGLCAPIGSLLVGQQAVIDRARKLRKLMGGGMRQTGVLAAAGLLALNTMSKRLDEDHKRADLLAKALDDLPGVSVIWQQRDINMVFFTMPETVIEEALFIKKMAEEGIIINGTEAGEYRFVTHHGITDETISHTIKAMKKIIAQ